MASSAAAVPVGVDDRGTVDATDVSTGITGFANGRDFTDGSWEGQFFGKTGLAATLHPTSVAGQFEASWGTPEAIASEVWPQWTRQVRVLRMIGFVGLSGVFGAEKVK